MRTGNRALVSLCAGLVVATAAAGQWSPGQKLTAADADALDNLGEAVALSGGTAVLGAPDDEELAAKAGAAYVFEKDASATWKETAKLLADDGAENDVLGFSVAVWQDVIVAGAPGNDHVGQASGAAYVFEPDGAGQWVQTRKLTPDDAASGDRFGSSVAVFADAIVVGADRDDDLAGDAGAAYVFERDGTGQWVQIDKLTPDDLTQGANFGYSAAMSGDRAIIGAIFANANAQTSGAAYVYKRTAEGDWKLEDKLGATLGDAFSWFGATVDIDAETAVVGAPKDGVGVFGDPGAAYVFQHTGDGTWKEIDRFEQFDDRVWDDFAASVGLEGDAMAIGATVEIGGEESDGAVYVYRRDESGTWQPETTLAPEGGSADDCFARALAVGEDAILVGAECDNEMGGQAGAAHVFDASVCEADFNADGTLDVLDFIAFQAAWQAGEPEADCNDDGVHNVIDFVCFQNLFQAGCP